MRLFADHLLVARDDLRAAVLGAEVRHQQEAIGEPARARLLQREALLVLLHRQHQAFGRNREERLVEGAHQHRRPLGEAGVLGEQRFVLDERQLVVFRQRMRLFADEARARRRVEDHLVRLELRLVVGTPRHVERRVAVKAVPARVPAALHGLDVEMHDLAREQAHDRVQRTHPLQLARSPAHGLGPRELLRHRRHHFRDDVVHGPAGLLRLHEVVVALLVGDDLGLVDRRDAGCAQEALDRLLRRTDTRPLALVLDFGRLRRQAVDHERQAARRCVGLALADRDAVRLEAVQHQLAQILRRPRLHPGRDLFGEHFEQQFGHGMT